MNRSLQATIVFAAAICFSHLHHGHLAGDAVRYAHIAKNILSSGDWFTLHDSFADMESYWNKPHLLFWLLAANFKVFGFSTFVAKLPSALFVFASLILLWKIVERLFGNTTALVAVLLFVGNRTFMRDILDLNVESISIFGALIILGSALELLHHKTPRPGLLGISTGLGILLLAQSKTPFLLLCGFPVVMVLLLRPKTFPLVWNRSFLLGVLPTLTLAALWYGSQESAYVAGAFDNQWINPIRENDKGFFKNIIAWLGTLIVSWSPLFIFGLWGYGQRILRWKRKRSLQVLNNAELLCLFWALPLLPIIILVDCRPRYLAMPMLAIGIIGAQSASLALSRLSPRALQNIAMAAGAICIVLFGIFDVRIHRENQIVEIAAAQLNSNSAPSDSLLLCVDRSTQHRSERQAKFSELLLDLEIGRRHRIYTSKELPLGGDTEVLQILANDYCAQNLRKNNPSLIEESRPSKKTVLFRAPALREQATDLGSSKIRTDLPLIS